MGVGACVGMRGSRVQTIVNELHGEKIDIIKWTEDLPTLISESLSPAEIQRVLTDKEDSERRQTVFKERTETLIKNLEVDETLGQLLVSEGFNSIEEISQSSPEDI